MTRSPRGAAPTLQPGARVLVTGAGSGIGRATALAFATRGAHVLAVDIDDEAATLTAKACREVGGGGDAWSCDVADWGAVRALAEGIHTDIGPLDVLVNNAGVGMTGRFADMSIEDWRWIRSINLDGVIHGCMAFAPAMLERGRGHIFNQSSGLGYTPRATEPAYVTTKAAVLALSQCLGADWGPKGVNVTAVCPGVINTPIAQATRMVGGQSAPDNRQRIERLFRRGHRPELVAEAIVGATGSKRAVLPVGWESRLGWVLHRAAPISWQQFIARRGPV